MAIDPKGPQNSDLFPMKPQPATSATTDMPDFGSAATPTSAPQGDGEGDEGGDESVAAGGEPEGGEPAAAPDSGTGTDVDNGDEPAAQPKPAKKRAPHGMQERFDEMTRKLYEARRENERLAGVIAEQTRTTQPEGDAEPNRLDFETPDEWRDAHNSWQIRQAVRQERARDQQVQAQFQQERTARAAEATFRERVKAAAEKHPDIVDVLSNANVFSQPLQAAIVMDSDGPEVAYFLATHPQEAVRLAGLGIVEAANAVGRIAMMLSMPSAASPVPKPPRPIVSRGRSDTRPLSDIPMEEYATRRNEVLRKQHRH